MEKESSTEKLETRLRIIMTTINKLEQQSGFGGAFAETIQEQCNAIAKEANSKLHFNIGHKNDTRNIKSSF